jgi:large subunit ribosomal protein L13
MRKWRHVDATGLPLGRLASEVASILRGKDKPFFTPHSDVGDFVVITNADKVVLKGKRLSQKVYHTHSGYAGGIKTTVAKDLLAKHPERVIELAVKRMLPKGPLGFQMYSKLKVYRGPEHPHAAQGPVPTTLRYCSPGQ